VLRSLFWKEWHEHWWKVLFGSVLAAGYVAVGLRTRILPDDAILVSCAAGASFLLPVLAAMDLVAAERADGRLNTLISLPVGSRMLLAVKMIIGSLICVVPQAVAMLVAILVAGGREQPTTHFVSVFAGGAALGLCLLLWTVSLGIRQASEARVALVGMAVIVLWLFVLPTIWIYFWRTVGWEEQRAAQSWWREISLVGLLVAGVEQSSYCLFQLLCIHVAAGTALFVWAARRLARPGRTRA
jgi:hypothetical protein